MDGTTLHHSVWALARAQHGIVTREQLLALGYTRHAIAHRIAAGRLHPLWRGVYAVGRPEVSRRGRWLAAVLSCGPEAVLSHDSAAALWGIAERPGKAIHVSVPAHVIRQRPGIVVHRRRGAPAAARTRHDAIPVTDPVCTLVDLSATAREREPVERAVNQADKLDLVDPEALRAALPDYAGVPGAALLREILDRRTFTMTDSELERRFLPLARRAGLPRPLTRQRLNGFVVDFHWPELKLVVETDGLRYHRTPAAQARDRLRDQTHAAAGLTPLRFTRAQVRHEPEHVVAVLRAVAGRLRAAYSTA